MAGDTNNLLSDAFSLGDLSMMRQVTNFTVNPRSDVDLFSFQASAGQEADIAVTRPPGSRLASCLRLFDSNGNPLALNENPPQGGLNAQLSFQISVTGTYYVGVSSRGNDHYDPVTGANAVPGTNTGDYILTVTRPGLPVVNLQNPIGRLTTAPFIGNVTQLLQVKNHQLTAPTTVQMFQFHVTDGEHVAFKIDHPATAKHRLDSILRLFDGSGDQLIFNDDGPTPGKPFSRDAYFEYTFATGGTYYVGVSSYPNANYDPNSGVVPPVQPGTIFDPSATTGPYTLTLLPGTFQPHPPNQVIGGATTLGDASQVRQVDNQQIVHRTDINLFRFTANAGQQVTFSVGRPAGSDLISVLRLFDANGNPIGPTAAGSPGNPNASLTFTFPTASTYYVGVSGRGNDHYNASTGKRTVRSNSIGSYTLTLAPAGAMTPNTSNNEIDRATPLPLNTPQSNLRIQAPSDVNIFSIDVTGGQSITISANPGDTSQLVPFLRLFDGNGNELASAAGTQLTFTFSFAGTYYVGVSSRGNTMYNALTGAGAVPGDTTGTYTLLAAPAANAAPPAAPSNPTLAAAVRLLRSASGAGPAVSGAVYQEKVRGGPHIRILIGKQVFLGAHSDGIPAAGDLQANYNPQGQFFFSGAQGSGFVFVYLPRQDQNEKILPPLFYPVHVPPGRGSLALAVLIRGF